MINIKKYILIFVLSGLYISSYSQFYNGHRMTFGKSRVQYNNFIWKFYRYDDFDTYFYQGGKNLSNTVASIAGKQISELENYFGYTLKGRIIFLCYNKLTDFRQSNIGYDAGDEQSNIGGVTRISGNKIFVYSEGDIRKLEKQIRKGVAQIIVNELIYGGNFRQKLTNSTLINLPEWYVSGLISYVTENWSVEIENKVKDGFATGEYDNVNHLIGQDATLAGHSIWNYIAETYGKDVIPNILYLTRMNKNPDSGFMYIIGSGIKQIAPVWKYYYTEKFETGNSSTNEVPTGKMKIKYKNEIFYSQIKYNKKGNKIAYVTNKKGKIKILIFNTETEKSTVIYKTGHKIDRINDYSYPLAEWHPSGKSLTFILELGGKIKLFTYVLASKELKERNLQYFDKILSYCYSKDGYTMLISAVKNGNTDIYLLNLASGTNINLTNDNADDFYPHFTEDEKKIVFSSNRKTDTLYYNTKKTEVNQTHNLFMYDLHKKKKILRNLTNRNYTNQTRILSTGKNKFLYLTDQNGIVNRNLLEYDSTIAFIDTSIHYRYFSKETIKTNYNRSIYEYGYNPTNNTVSDVIFNKNRFGIYNSELNSGTEIKPKEIFNTEFINKIKIKRYINDSLKIQKIKEEREFQQKIDSLRQNPPANIIHPDSVKHDINNYVFEQESPLLYYDIYPIDSLKQDSVKFQQRNYLTNFYTDYLMQQVDFGFLNSSYQAFTGDAFYFNPGLNIFMKLGVYDLFEDYRVTGGVRIGGNSDSYEFLFSVEDLKNRIDKQYIYHRQTFVNEFTDNLGYPVYGKIFTNELIYILKYPFSEVTSFKFTSSLRHDKSEILSLDYPTLLAGKTYQFFAGLKSEFIFDNTYSRGINLYEGLRFKLFGEFYQEIDQKYTNLFVLGGDFRYYYKIHRNLIFASRFAGSSSFGKSKLIYYLGGVDNWFKFSPEKLMFDKSVKINNKEDYVYQAVATNMRGFVQNVRNGTNFFVINAELRFPVIRYFANRPLNSDFLNNFQIVGFTDLGSAWSGLTPYSSKNAYTTETVKEGPVTVVIDKNRAPIVIGYGLGLRSRLFGYFFRLDWAYGIERDVILPRIFYFSLNLDF